MVLVIMLSCNDADDAEQWAIALYLLLEDQVTAWQYSNDDSDGELMMS